MSFNMKKLLLFLVIAIPLFANAQITTFETCANVHGYWTSWQPRNQYYQYLGTSSNEMKYMISYNRYSKVFNGLEFRKASANEWDWCFKVEIYNYTRPDKKERKAHEKSKQWYEYSGWVEYYVTDEYPTIEKVLETYKFPLISPTGETARAKRRARATIKIAPYKKEPTCFNVYFDGVGVGFSFRSWPFDKSYVVQ